ncbi:hypothetical protein HMPREF1991_01999 [Hoylesella loescheii DSM 19665 = JCM 12249 = ATCC 15930]|uniref:Uncharacterized protein n=1 Tax=Hoylesella loescheii DSM 19665 = JCM 12249 = ATCC 15930 TaxID=1122985 RepID=A0A069QIP8_HOYLO|nr:hypothetical protein HMPREF1991_01999 [Hoylesella loescheii DSM 19665 = JCM 12249 = ATCC 15930]
MFYGIMLWQLLKKVEKALCTCIIVGKFLILHINKRKTER